MDVKLGLKKKREGENRTIYLSKNRSTLFVDNNINHGLMSASSYYFPFAITRILQLVNLPFDNEERGAKMYYNVRH